MTSLTPRRSRRISDRRPNDGVVQGPEDLGLRRACRQAEPLAPAIGAHRDRDRHRHRGDPARRAHPHVGGVEPRVRPLACRPGGATQANPWIGRVRKAFTRSSLPSPSRKTWLFGTPDPPSSAARSIRPRRSGRQQPAEAPGPARPPPGSRSPARTPPRDGLLAIVLQAWSERAASMDHGRQRLFRRAPGLRETRKVRALAQLRDPQLDRAGAGFPKAVATAVAVVDAPKRPPAGTGAAKARHLQIRQALGDVAQHPVQHVDVRALLQELAKRHPVRGHRGLLLDRSSLATQPYRSSTMTTHASRPARLRQLCRGRCAAPALRRCYTTSGDAAVASLPNARPTL